MTWLCHHVFVHKTSFIWLTWCWVQDLWIFFTCVFKELFSEKCLSHISHLNLLISTVGSCTLPCFCKLIFSEKTLPHTLHWNLHKSFLSLWFLWMCWFRTVFSVNSLRQSLHLCLKLLCFHERFICVGQDSHCNYRICHNHCI